MLEIDHLTKRFGDKTAVDDLTLHIAPGEVYGFIGHNGAGKTTTIKCAVGITQPDAGTVTIDGRSRAWPRCPSGFSSWRSARRDTTRCMAATLPSKIT